VEVAVTMVATGMPEKCESVASCSVSKQTPSARKPVAILYLHQSVFDFLDSPHAAVDAEARNGDQTDFNRQRIDSGHSAQTGNHRSNSCTHLNLLKRIFQQFRAEPDKGKIPACLLSRAIF